MALTMLGTKEGIVLVIRRTLVSSRAKDPVPLMLVYQSFRRAYMNHVRVALVVLSSLLPWSIALAIVPFLG